MKIHQYELGWFHSSLLVTELIKKKRHVIIVVVPFFLFVFFQIFIACLLVYTLKQVFAD